MEETFGQLVQMKRNLLGLSMRELARRTSVDVAYISKIEKGQATMPSFSVVMRLAKELGFKMETLQKAFQLDEDTDSVIGASIANTVSGAEKEAIQGIVEGIVELIDYPKFNIEGLGGLLQKVYNLHQQKHQQDEIYHVITIIEKDWVQVLQTPTIDEQLLDLYNEAYELREGNTFIVKGDILDFPDYFSYTQVQTLHDLLEKCSLVNEQDDLYISFLNLKEYLEKFLNK